MEVVKGVKKAFNSGITRDIKWRKQQLQALYQMLVDHEKEALEALSKDLHKCRAETYMCELNVIKLEIANLIHNVDKWAKPRKIGKSMLTITDTCYVQYQPYGVCLILSAWNYPLQISLVPLAGAIVAGNCAILKPSEVAPATEQFMAKYIPEYLDKNCFPVYCGGVQETTEILKERFDLIFYTGNSMVAKIIMTAASKNLTPVVLELGGKSPTFVSDKTDINMAAHRIVWGKTVNAGQTCIAPDYVLCQEAIKDKLIESLQTAVKEFYGEKISESDDYARIINERHFSRISNMLESSKGKVIQCGNEDSRKDDKFIPPILVSDVSPDDSTMQDEIFGPILPIITVKNHEEAIEFINEREKPLALYVFTNDSNEWRDIEAKTSSGGLLLNDTVLHAAVDGLPFGGVGNSGVGRYHGAFSFEAFSHQRAVVNKSVNETMNNMARYPPYTDSKVNLLSWVMGSNPKSSKWCSIM